MSETSVNPHVDPEQPLVDAPAADGLGADGLGANGLGANGSPAPVQSKTSLPAIPIGSQMQRWQRRLPEIADLE